MAAEGDNKSKDFYNILGLKKECTLPELKHAYKKLALKWHPDRLSASGNTKYVEEAKTKFQAIQQAYSVLSDGNKRFLYDVGVYDCDDDDDENGMGDFLNEMTAMMSQSKSDENGKKESFEELQELYNELFESDTPCSSSAVGLNSTGINSGDRRAEIASPFQGFCFGSSEPHQGGESSRRKNTRKGRRW
ncbi:hypothetical protein ABFS83_09G121000 [Erythranthe nasuta]